MHFFYDAQSRPAMVDFNGALYSYVHNLQGDVVGIVDSAGSLVVEYKYDAWGKPTLVRTLTTAYEALAELNPFRYRGYVYDEETGLYYLRSRFYSPQLTRFLNPDAIVGVIGSILQQNLFLYASNMPTIFGDANGRFLCTLIGAVTGAISGLVTAIRTDDDILACVVAGAAEGAITGMTLDLAATGVGVPLMTVMTMGGIGAATGEIVYQSIKYGGIVSYGDIAIEGVMGVLTEPITFEIGTRMGRKFKAFSDFSDTLYKRARELAAEGFEEAADKLFRATVKAGKDYYLYTSALKPILSFPVNKVSSTLTEEMKAKFEEATQAIRSMTPIERVKAALGL